MKKRIVSFLLCLCLLAALMPSVAAQETVELTFASADTGMPLGDWMTIEASDSEDGTGFSFSNNRGDYYLFHFTGTQAQWIGTKGSIYGKAKIYIDNIARGEIDCYAAETQQNAVCYSVSGLEDDTLHTIRIEVLGQKNALADDSYINIRGFMADKPDTFIRDAQIAWLEETEEISTDSRTGSDPETWTPTAYAAEVPTSGVTLGDGPIRDSYEKFKTYLLHSWNSNEESEVFRATVDSTVLPDFDGFLDSGDLSFCFGGNDSQSAVMRDITLTGAGGNGLSDWLLGNSWSGEVQSEGSSTVGAEAIGVELTHVGEENASDAAVYTEVLQPGFNLSFIADFSANANAQLLNFKLTSADGEVLSCELTGNRNDNAYGTIGYYTASDGWNGQMFRAENWVGNPTGKVRVTLTSTGESLRITMADCAGSSDNTFETVLDGNNVWVLPYFFAKDLTLSFVGGNVCISALDTGERENPSAQWQLGSGWTAENVLSAKSGVNAVHTGAASTDDQLLLVNSLSGNGYEVSFILDFSDQTEKQEAYFVLRAEDSQTITGNITLDPINCVFGTVGQYVAADGWTGQVFRADSWVGCPSKQVKVTLRADCDGALHISMADVAGSTINTWSATLDGNTVWTLPMLFTKDMGFGIYADCVSVKSLCVESAGADNSPNGWTVGTGWTVEAAGASGAEDAVLTLAHSGMNSDTALYTHGLSSDAFSAEFLADFSDNDDTQAMNFRLVSADGRTLSCQIIGHKDGLFGFEGFIEGNQVLRASSWITNDSRKVRIRLENTGDDVLTVTVKSIPVVEDNIYCDSLFWAEWLPASNEGRMLMGAGNLLRWEDDEVYQEIIDTIVSDMEERMREDGWYNYYDESDYAAQTGSEAERKNYDRQHWTRGLLSAGAAGNETAYELLRKFYDWFENSEYLGEMVLGSNATNGFAALPMVANSPIGTAEDMLTSQKYYDLEFFMEALAKEDPLAIAYYPGDRPHSTMLNMFEGYVESYLATGDEKYLNAVVGGWEVYHDYYTHIGGSGAICEDTFGSYYPGSYQLDMYTGETCGSVYWINASSKLLSLFPTEEKYAAEIERVLYNVMLAAQGDNGNIRYHNNLQNGKDTTGCVNSCCEVLGADLYARLPEFICSIADDGVYLNQYYSATVDVSEDFSLDIDTQFPYDGNVAVTVRTADAVSTRLRIRIPSWAVENVNVYVNGKLAVSGTPGTYIELNREWVDGDIVTFDLPLTLRVEQYTGEDQVEGCERYGVLYGPILLSLTGPMEGIDGVPVLDMDTEELLNSLQRVNNTLEFRIDGVSDRSFIPYWSIDTGTSFCCFPVLGTTEREDMGEYGWETDEIDGVKDFSGWTFIDSETIEVVYDKTTGEHRIWKNLITNQNDFSVELDVTTDNTSSAYVKVLGVILELDSSGGDGNQSFVKINGENYDWISGDACEMHVLISREDGGELNIGVVGKNGDMLGTTVAAREENENLELGLYRGIASFNNISVTCADVPVEPTEPTEPSVEPTEPSVEPTEPSVEPTEPSVEPTEPSVEPTEPPVEPEEPCDGGKDCAGHDFTDMPAASDWAHEGIDYAVKNGLMNGMGNNKFEPETSMTRAMLVTVLWRNAGSPKEGKNTFTDVKNGQWYTDAIAWAAANGIVNGMGNNTFEPDTEITREQMATILYRYANLLKIDTSARAELKSFKDASDVNDWAKEAVQWAVASGVITGSKEPDGTYLFPQNPATRAQVATMLMRYLKTVID